MSVLSESHAQFLCPWLRQVDTKLYADHKGVSKMIMLENTALLKKKKDLWRSIYLPCQSVGKGVCGGWKTDARWVLRPLVRNTGGIK